MTHKTGVTCSPVQGEAECDAQAWRCAARSPFGDRCVRRAGHVDDHADAEPAHGRGAGYWPRSPEERIADLERQRDEARAEAERLRLGRVELLAMWRAAVAEVERLRRDGRP